MNETVWVALIAVLGTSLGAAISPTISLIRDIAAARTDSRTDRLRAAAEYGTRLLAFEICNPERFDSAAVRRAHREVMDARFELARHLVRGEGNVDRFAEHAIAMVARYTDARRQEAAEYAASRVLDWARGDISPANLHLFEFLPNGPEFVLA
ncbi:hypothetical protein GE115_10160 [Agromyces sp. CFH 90414]|uniref:Uncharacterized protein n=1 Tax=Agromyces agglutinans TaxID=2662258 RepID=A0A6I2FH70_9MICO|nr:hypothetical protein [Agromyces agglutinans]MRG60228.1 hypothetical protein [Agromyces agglutinans]